MLDFPRDSYDSLDIQVLTNLLCDPAQKVDVHLRALNALTRVNSDERRTRLILVMNEMMKHPAQYDSEVQLALVEALATDPHPAATAAMLQILPDVLAGGMANHNTLPSDFREYYYQALATRSREGDLEVWREALPQLSPQSLVALLLDPVGQPLVDAIEPLELLSRFDEPERSRALVSVIVGLTYAPAANPRTLERAVELLQHSDAERLASCVEVLEERWSRARRNKRADVAAKLETALAKLDTRPRTRTEKLRGRRPWAS
ncbi:MAG: hypothetical protein GX484_07510 [Chloroflexi bacterium]|nr:hypothetical protein [Chloroflexota bacterium]HOA23776.1 hypothetical protein [Aggregatilineales bacterium]